MKVKILSISAIISVAVTGLMVLFFLASPDNSETSHLNNPNQISVIESDAARSISKGTILLLLSVGVIGVLGVARKKKYRGDNAQSYAAPQVSGHHDVDKDNQKIRI